MGILITILIFGLIVLVHEYGHFIVAKKSGVHIEEFAIGMGPKLISKEKNKTIYSIRALPLGGFCKMKGEDEKDNSPDSFNNIPILKKILIVFAGPLMNFILAIIIFTSFNLTNGIITTKVKTVIENSPAYEIGIKPNDIIYKINGKKVHTYDYIAYYLSKESENLKIEVKRNNEILKFDLNPIYNEQIGRYLIGISMVSKEPFFSKESTLKTGVFESIITGFQDMLFTVRVTVSGLLDLITLKIPIEEVRGPIGITPIVEETYQTALEYSTSKMITTMLNLTALLSANIGIMNLLPIPALDGGRLVFLFIELIRKKAIPQEKEGIIHFIGFSILIAFGAYIAFKDILRLF